MSREITAPTPSTLVSTSHDGKHTIQFNEASHRYKLDGKACTGVTTFIKAGYPTSMGLIQWMKGQSINYIWETFTEPSEPAGKYFPKDLDAGYTENDKKELFKAAKAADQKPAQEAADIGTLVHDFAYLSELGKTQEAKALQNQIIQLPLESKTKILNGINRFNDWKKETKDELIKSEALVASPTHLFCGKFDRLARRNGRLVLGDFKTSNSIYLEHFIQLAAYRLAIREWFGLEVSGLEVLRFGKEDGEFETILIDKPEEITMFENQAIRCKQTYDFRKMEQDPRWDWKKK